MKLGDRLPSYLKSTMSQVKLPESIQTRQECARYGIDLNTDYLTIRIIVFSFYIENVNKILYELRQQKLAKNGISRIENAKEEDFNNL